MREARDVDWVSGVEWSGAGEECHLQSSVLLRRRIIWLWCPHVCHSTYPGFKDVN
jgi:hypothetical protein